VDPSLGDFTGDFLQVGFRQLANGGSRGQTLPGRVADLVLAVGETPTTELDAWYRNGGNLRSIDEIEAHLGLARDGTGTIVASYRLDETTDEDLVYPWP